MKMRLSKLELTCKKAVEVIPFTNINYFYGEMGAGKSTIARLIDYCLGSSQLVMTPALQSEFVSVALELNVGEKSIRIERERESGQVLARWDDQQIILPVRAANGPVIPETEVEVLSDLIFYINGQRPPRVRKSQLNEDSALERLSIRDLLWYCYLDQDSMDSSFFSLDRDADTFKRLKSRNVLRAILGVHQEKVAELEQRLEEIRRERLGYLDSAKVLEGSLIEAKFSSLEEIDQRTGVVKDKLQQLEKRIKAIREEKEALVGHVTDRLRGKARQVATELETVETTIEELTDTNLDDKRHLNEIMSLSTKVRRLQSARAVLNDVDFVTCPKCTQTLPPRTSDECSVCGQMIETDSKSETDGEATQADIESRMSEIKEMMDAQTVQLRRLRRRRDDLNEFKQKVDIQLVQQLKQYDSAYLAEAISVEKQRAELTEELKYLLKMRFLPVRVNDLKKRADFLATDESTTRRELRDARAAAEQDLSNLQKLKKLFLDCLMRAKIPGFEADNIVQMTPPWFLPEVVGASGDIATTSFSTLGSGGKKNLFKCCFAIAVHRLSSELGTLLPTLLIIDSPMKNISERENRPQFEAFHQMIYQLAEGELKDTQIILIDKEFCPPEPGLEVLVKSRHMRVGSKEDPPLISYYGVN